MRGLGCRGRRCCLAARSSSSRNSHTVLRVLGWCLNVCDGRRAAALGALLLGLSPARASERNNNRSFMMNARPKEEREASKGVGVPQRAPAPERSKLRGKKQLAGRRAACGVVGPGARRLRLSSCSSSPPASYLLRPAPRGERRRKPTSNHRHQLVARNCCCLVHAAAAVKQNATPPNAPRRRLLQAGARLRGAAPGWSCLALLLLQNGNVPGRPPRPCCCC